AIRLRPPVAAQGSGDMGQPLLPAPRLRVGQGTIPPCDAPDDRSWGRTDSRVTVLRHDCVSLSHHYAAPAAHLHRKAGATSVIKRSSCSRFHGGKKVGI